MYIYWTKTYCICRLLPRLDFNTLWRLDFNTLWSNTPYHTILQLMITRKRTWPKRVYNDVYTRPPSLTLASWDLDLWPPDPKVDRNMPLHQGPSVPIYSKISSFIFETSCSHKIGNEWINEWTERYIGQITPLARIDWVTHKKCISKIDTNNPVSAYTVGTTDNGIKQSFSGPTEWQLTSKQNVQQNTQWPDVDRLTTWLRPNHFWCHVMCRSNIIFSQIHTMWMIQLTLPYYSFFRHHAFYAVPKKCPPKYI